MQRRQAENCHYNRNRAPLRYYRNKTPLWYNRNRLPPRVNKDRMPPRGDRSRTPSRDCEHRVAIIEIRTIEEGLSGGSVFASSRKAYDWKVRYEEVYMADRSMKL